MPYQHIHQISEWLAGTDIALLELRGPQGSIRLVNEAGHRAATPAATMVASPGIGLFLHRHPMSATALAPTGALVEAGQLIGLLQVGVLLIPISAPCAGRVAGHLVAHGDCVDFGAKLICLTSQTPQAKP